MSTATEPGEVKKSPLIKMVQSIAFSYLLLVIVYLALSIFFPQALNSLGLPLWGEINILIRWIIVLYGIGLGVLAVVSVFAKDAISNRLSDNRQDISMWILLIVVLVIIPGSIILDSFPATIQIIIAQITLILVFTAVPASLYPLFITSKGRTLWEEFVRNLSFLDPVDYENQKPIYKKKFNALYGHISDEGSDKVSGPQLLTSEATFPVLLNTLIIGLGWLLFFLSNAVEVKTTITNGVVNPFTFGFLGAYIFSLQMLFRRYVQSDLKTTAYTHASQRILITWVWAFILVALPWEIINLGPGYQNQIVSILAFVIGFFPDIAWQVIGRFIKLTLGMVIPSTRQEHPLKDISGITVWVEARLLEEKIEDIQNLVTMDIPDLMLRTNLHPSRIIDWVDQGILRLHLTQVPVKEKGSEEKKDSNKGSKEEKDLENELKIRGIIKATDLYFSYKVFRDRNKDNKGKYLNFLSRDLDPIVEAMIDSFEDDVNMYHIRAWRNVYAKQTKMLPTAIKKLLDREKT